MKINLRHVSWNDDGTRNLRIPAIKWNREIISLNEELPDVGNSQKLIVHARYHDINGSNFFMQKKPEAHSDPYAGQTYPIGQCEITRESEFVISLQFSKNYTPITASQAAATLGRMTSERKKKTSAENGRKSKKGGRPRKGAYNLELVYDSGAMVNVDSGLDTLADAVEALNKRPPVPGGSVLITRGDGVFYNGDGKRVDR